MCIRIHCLITHQVLLNLLIGFFPFLPLPIFSIEQGVESKALVQSLPYIPWFTGPLLAPTPVNMRPGHPSIEPIVTIAHVYGVYDSNWEVKSQPKFWSVSPLIDFQLGITDYLGLEFDVSFISNFQKGRSSTYLQDTFMFFGYQISNDTRDSWIPDCRLLIQEIFPTGKYRKLNPKKVKIESTGQGSFQTGVVLAFQKLFRLPNQLFALHWNLSYLFFQSKADVQGFNTYGGSPNTKGKATPGQTIIAMISGEYSMNQNWVFVFDIAYSHQRKSHFSGKKGQDSLGDQAVVTLPASTQISVTPGLEYNFDINNGLLFGTWFTLAGENTNAFAALYLAYVHTF